MLARMLKLSLIAYMSGGAFLSLGWFDLPWHIIAIAYILKNYDLCESQPDESAEQVPDRHAALPGLQRPSRARAHGMSL